MAEVAKGDSSDQEQRSKDDSTEKATIVTIGEAAKGDSSDEEQPRKEDSAAGLPSLPSGLSSHVSRRFSIEFEKVRGLQFPGYGTMDGEPPPGDKLSWFARGSFRYLVQDIGFNYGAFVMLVCSMVLVPFWGQISIDTWFPCDLKAKYIETYTGSIICEYTKTYVWSFPQLALASLLLLIGRDYVQKRFYYFMLKNGGVMSFLPRPLLRDTIVAVNLWAFGHFIVFCVLVAWRLWLGGIEPGNAALNVAKATMKAARNPWNLGWHQINPVKDSKDPEGLQLLISMLIFLGLPGVIFLSKLLSSYNIELTLVPLSEYIRDITTGTLSAEVPGKEDAESDEESPMLLGATDLANLVPMKDTCVHGLFQAHPKEVYMSHKDGQNRYERVLKLYKKPQYKLDKEPDRIELLEGLWPAPFVTAKRRFWDHETTSEPDDATQPDKIDCDMSASTTINQNVWQDRAGEWTFNAVWQTYRQTSILVCFAILVCQGAALFIDLRRCFTEHWQALFSSVGEFINIYIVGQILYQFYVAKSPA